MKNAKSAHVRDTVTFSQSKDSPTIYFQESDDGDVKSNGDYLVSQRLEYKAGPKAGTSDNIISAFIDGIAYIQINGVWVVTGDELDTSLLALYQRGILNLSAMTSSFGSLDGAQVYIVKGTTRDSDGVMEVTVFLDPATSLIRQMLVEQTVPTKSFVEIVPANVTSVFTRVLYQFSNYGSTVPINHPALVATAGGSMSLYESPSNGFLLRYPATWTRRPVPSNSSAVIFAADDNLLLAISEEDTKPAGSLTLDQYVDLVIRAIRSNTAAGFVQTGRARLALGQRAAVRLVYTSTDGQVTSDRLVAIDRNGVAFNAAFTTLSTRYNQNKPLIEATFDTFGVKSSTQPPIARLYGQAPETQIDTNKKYTATLITNLGEVTIELFPKQAPATVNNFVYLAREGFFVDTKFHRVLNGSSVEGGDRLTADDSRMSDWGRGLPGYTIADEFPCADGSVTNSIRPACQLVQTFNQPGMIAMSNARDGGRAGSQFFITLAPAPASNGSFAIFGKVTSGLEVVQGISAISTQCSRTRQTEPSCTAVPELPAVILRVTITEE